MAHDRACHILAAELRRVSVKGVNDGFVTRDRLIKVLQKSRYASTAESHLASYTNDIRVYLKGELEVETLPHSRYATKFKLVNFADFTDNGYNIKLEQENVPIGERREQHKAMKKAA